MDRESFSHRLTQLRNERNISARELSVKLGQNVGYINKIENQKTLPSMEAFFYMCEYMKITPAQFFDENISHPIMIHEINAELAKMNREQLQHILDIVRDINK